MIHHLLKLNTAGLTAIVGVNDAPLLVDPTGVGLNSAWPVNPWLKPQGNALGISLATPPRAPNVIRPPTGLPAVDVRAQLYSVKPDSNTNEIDRILATFARTAGDPAPLPVNRAIPFEITAPPPTKLWSDAATVSALAPPDKEQLKTLVQKHAAAIEARDLDALLVLLDYKIRDCALANGQDPEHMRQVTRQQYTNVMFSERSFRVETGPLSELQFKLIAGGQVVWMFQSLSKPALVVLSPKLHFTLPIYAAKIDGVWRIVR